MAAIVAGARMRSAVEASGRIKGRKSVAGELNPGAIAVKKVHPPARTGRQRHRNACPGGG